MSAPDAGREEERAMDRFLATVDYQCAHCRSYGKGRERCETCGKMLCAQCRLPMFDKSVRHECRPSLARFAEFMAETPGAISGSAQEIWDDAKAHNESIGRFLAGMPRESDPRP